VSPELSVIIVNWNTSALLRRAVAGVIAAAPAAACEIIIVDNASADGSVAALRADAAAGALLRDGSLRIVENAENRGFGTACNQAFALSRAPLVLLLNPDTVVTPQAIDALIAEMHGDPRIGACGPRLVNPDGSLQVSVWRNPPTPWEIVLSNQRLFHLLPKRFRGELLLGRHWPHDRRRTVPMLSAAALLIRREAIDRAGGFDERFHMYGEDNEWCLRVRRDNWLLVFQPAAVVRHDEARSAVQRWSVRDKRAVQLEASFLFQRLSLGRWHLAANQLACCGTAALHYCWRRARGLDTSEIAMQLRVHLRHLRRALVARDGSRVRSEAAGVVIGNRRPL
jgi:N-acetylglucosaminyl-diphospho-decaprenol L-rhamnosyltransferase